MDRHCCRLCLKKGKIALVDALLIPELCKSVKCFFGFEILQTDRCSTKICVECVTQITDALGYKNRVLYNQECLKKEQLLRAQIQSIKIEDNEEDDDVMIVEENSTPRSQEDLHQVSSSRLSPVTFPFKQTARKSTTKLPLYVPPPRPTAKELCPKRLKIVCYPICEKDVSKVRIPKKTQDILKVKGKKDQTKSKVQRKARISLTTDPERRRAIVGEVITDPSKFINSQATTKKMVTLKAKQPESASAVPVTSAKGSSLLRGNNSSCKPIATISPSEAGKGKVVWCSIPNETRGPQNIATMSKPTAAQNAAFNYLAKYLAKSVAKANANSKNTPPLSTIKVTTTAPAAATTELNSLTCNSSGVSLGLASTSITENSKATSNTTHVYLPHPVKQQNVVSTLYVNNGSGVLPATSTSLRANKTISGTVDLSGVIYPYVQEKQLGGASPLRYILPANTSVSLNTSRQQSYPPLTPIQSKSEINTAVFPTDLNDSSLNLNKVKVLTVNELNTRASQQPPASIATSKSQRLPIRISLTRMRNEMVIKLSDAQGKEITYNELDPSEMVAVRTSLLSKESIRQFGQAFQTCAPDGYTTELLNTLGLSKASFANAVL